MTVTIYHNPKCSNSLGALALLRERGIEPVIIAYLETPPTSVELAELAAKLEATAGAAWPGLRDGMMRKDSFVYIEMGLEHYSDEKLLRYVAMNPIVLNRPIVVTPKGAKLCRPPELVLQIL